MNGKKIMMFMVIIMGVVAIIIGIIYKNVYGEKYFNATVLEMHDGYMLVKPLPSEDIYKSTDKILVSCEEEYLEDDNVIIYYKGEINETYPSTLDVTRVERVSINVNNDNSEEINDNTDIKDNSNVDKESNNSDDSDIDNKVEEDKNSEDNKEINYIEEDVVNYFESELEKVSSYSKTSQYKEKAKNLFISIIDFLFYDKEIKGYTFSELSDSAKLKVLNIAFKLDNKIEELFPNYKDSLADNYNEARDSIVTKYLEITVKICSNNEEYCDKAKDVWGTIKEKAGLSWEVIKEYAGKGISNLKEWYEIYSGK